MFSLSAHALDLNSRLLLSVILNDNDNDTWPGVRDLDRGDGFAGDANLFLNGQLSYPSILEGLPVELHICYLWTGLQVIHYFCLLEEQILGIFQ